MNIKNTISANNSGKTQENEFLNRKTVHIKSENTADPVLLEDVSINAQ